jgi:GNAT superfamily N-acetyltransferase
MRLQSDLRTATADDAHVISELALRSKAHWGYSPEFMQACQQELTHTPEQILHVDSFYVVAETQDRAVVGFYALQRQCAGLFELDALFVEPEFIGRGIGRQLVEHALGEARRRGGLRLQIQGDPHAQSFYLTMGGRRIGERKSGSIAGRMLPLFEIDLNSTSQLQSGFD